MGNNVKEGIPFATSLGLVAVELAAQGFTGPIDFLDEEARYDRTILTSDLGGSWLIETTYFKPYGCCRWAHAAIDALLDLMRDEHVGADEIKEVRVETFTQTLWLNNDLAPPTLEAAQYSVPFCLAAAAIHGGEALLPIENSLLADPKVLAFAPRVIVEIAPDLDAMFPQSVPARIAATTARGIFRRTVLAPRGEPSNPLSDDDLREKFSAIAQGRLAPSISTALRDAFAALDAGELGPLLACLGAAPALARTTLSV